MKRFNLFEMYSVCKELRPLAEVQEEDLLAAKAYGLWTARNQLMILAGDKSPLLSSSRRCCQDAIKAIELLIPHSLTELRSIEQSKKVGFQALYLNSAIRELETVLAYELPDVAAYIVAQKGIYRTEDLIEHGDRQVSPLLVGLLPPLAVSDLREAGKCLAYELGTACAFHLWRAVETVIAFYYRCLASQSFKEAKINSNWGAYISALANAGAPDRVTVLLKHIKDSYRNPVSHPEEIVELSAAQGLFSIGTSCIDMLLEECYKVVSSKYEVDNKGAVPIPPVFSCLEKFLLDGCARSDRLSAIPLS